MRTTFGALPVAQAPRRTPTGCGSVCKSLWPPWSHSISALLSRALYTTAHGRNPSWMDLPSALDEDYRHSHSISPPLSSCLLASPEAEPTPPRSWLGAVSCRTTTRATASAPLTRSSWPSDAMRWIFLLCKCSKCCVPRTALSALMRARRVLGLQLCRMVTSS